MNLQTFGHRLQILRNNAGLTQADLGREAGLSMQQISHIEADRRFPSIPSFQRICRALAVTPNIFLEAVYVIEVPPCPFCGFGMDGGPVCDDETLLWQHECAHCGALGPWASNKEDATTLAYCRGKAIKVANRLREKEKD